MDNIDITACRFYQQLDLATFEIAVITTDEYRLTGQE